MYLGSAVGFALPSSMNFEDKNYFESLLLNLCGMQFFPPGPPELQTLVDSFQTSQNGGNYAMEQNSQQIVDFTTPTEKLVTQISDGVMAGQKNSLFHDKVYFFLHYVSNT